MSCNWKTEKLKTDDYNYFSSRLPKGDLSIFFLILSHVNINVVVIIIIINIIIIVVIVNTVFIQL